MKPPAFQFYPDDFIGGTCDLSAEEVGAYIRLLCYQWSRGSIPDDSAKLARIAGANVTTDTLQKFPSGKNARLEFEREKQAEYRAEKSKAGKSGAEKRWHSHSTAIVLPLANTMANDSSPSPSPSPSPSLIPTPTSPLTEPAPPSSVDQDLKLETPLAKASKPKPSPPDPRRQEFLNIFREYFEQGIGETWAGPDAADNAQLKRLFTRHPDMTPDEWREYLLYIHHESQKEYAPNLLRDCGTLALVCSKWDRIKIYSARK